MQPAVKQSVRDNCVGALPLDAKLEPWMEDLLEGCKLQQKLESFGSPLNVLSTEPFKKNILSLKDTAKEFGVDFEVYFARKANKCLSFINAAAELECGIDTASLPELEQVIEAGFNPAKTICTAAIKSKELIRRCITSGVVLAVDNHNELQRVKECAQDIARIPDIALRISGFQHDGQSLFSRFGFDINKVVAVVKENLTSGQCFAAIKGIHFHLDGYCHQQRVSAINQSLLLIDQLRELGHDIRFLDIGGGIPVSYLNSEEQWSQFWCQHKQALLGNRESLTYRNHGLGLLKHEGQIVGKPKSYPYYQSLVRSNWLREILSADCDGESISDAIKRRKLSLHCEPGRSVLDGCGMTVAKVEFTKKHRDGHWLIGLAMNHTQCRTSSDDFLVDPVVVKSVSSNQINQPATESMEGFLVGAYCTESELLCKRRLHFPNGIGQGDLVIFPNTAGYFMHFLESRSHQFPLAKNVFVDAVGDFRLDKIDTPDDLAFESSSSP